MIQELARRLGFGGQRGGGVVLATKYLSNWNLDFIFWNLRRESQITKKGFDYVVRMCVYFPCSSFIPSYSFAGLMMMKCLTSSTVYLTLSVVFNYAIHQVPPKYIYDLFVEWHQNDTKSILMYVLQPKYLYPAMRRWIQCDS